MRAPAPTCRSCRPSFKRVSAISKAIPPHLFGRCTGATAPTAQVAPALRCPLCPCRERRLRSLSLRRASTDLSPEFSLQDGPLRLRDYRGGCSFGTGRTRFSRTCPDRLARAPNAGKGGFATAYTGSEAAGLPCAATGGTTGGGSSGTSRAVARAISRNASHNPMLPNTTPPMACPIITPDGP